MSDQLVSARLRRLFVLLACLVIAVVLGSGCRQVDESLLRIQESGRIRIGLDPTFPPFESADGQPLEGFDVELAEALASRLNVEPEFVYFGYDGLYDALATKQVDVLISALVIQPERTRDFAYSDPYFDAGQVLVVPAESPLETAADLRGRILAVELGAEGHVAALEWNQAGAGIDIMPANTAEEAIRAVAGNEVDAALVDNISGSLMVAEGPALQVAGQPITSEPFSMVVRIEDEALLESLNNALRELAADGRLDQIRRRWLGR
jgi:polar amino acid transport system substrate-binding protein